MNKKTAIVAGASGFLGTTLMQQLGSHYNFVALTRSFPQMLPQADVLFHVAGVTAGRVSKDSTDDVCAINTTITTSLIELARQAKIPRIVFASSYIYGTPASLPISESHAIQALSPYMKSKILSEELLQKAVQAGAPFQVTSLRIFNLYGPGQRPGMLIPDILAQLEKPVIQIGDPRPKRDFVYSHDVAEAFHNAESASMSPFEAINIGSGKSHSVADVVDLISRARKRALNVEYHTTQRSLDIPDVVADIQKAKRLLGWSPRTSLETGLDFTTHLSGRYVRVT